MELHPTTREEKRLLEKLLASTSSSAYDIAQTFPVFATRRTLARFLSHYEIFKLIVDIPGFRLGQGRMTAAFAGTRQTGLLADSGAESLAG